jgi:hypothetical protein
MRGWILLASAATALTGCGAANPDALLGRWVSDRHIDMCDGRVFRLDLRARGVLAVGNDPGTWRIEGDRLVTTFTEAGAGAAETVQYQIEGDRVRTLDGNDHGEVLVRCGSPTANELRAQRRRAPDQVNIVDSPMDGITDNQMPMPSNGAGM